MNKNINKKNIEEVIKLKYAIIEKAKKELAFAMVFDIMFLLLVFWAFTGYVDPMLPNIGPVVRTIMKFVSVIGVFGATAFIVIYLIGINRTKKILLKEIDDYKKI